MRPQTVAHSRPQRSCTCSTHRSPGRPAVAGRRHAEGAPGGRARGIRSGTQESRLRDDRPDHDSRPLDVSTLTVPYLIHRSAASAIRVSRPLKASNVVRAAGQAAQASTAPRAPANTRSRTAVRAATRRRSGGTAAMSARPPAATASAEGDVRYTKRYPFGCANSPYATAAASPAAACDRRSADRASPAARGCAQTPRRRRFRGSTRAGCGKGGLPRPNGSGTNQGAFSASAVAARKGIGDRWSRISRRTLWLSTRAK